MASDAVQLLHAVQKQHEESMAHLDGLKREHHAWQQTVKEFLARLDSNDYHVDLNKSMSALPEASRSPSLMPLDETLALNGATKRLESARKTVHDAAESQFNGTRLPKLLEEVLNDGKEDEVEEVLTEWERRRRKVAQIVNSNGFEYVTGFLILMNISLIGIEAEMSLLNLDTVWATEIERVFLTLYTIELLLRLAAGGAPMFRSAWFLLDLFLVAVGLLALVVVPLVETSATSQESWMQLLIVRGLRLLRLARVLRTIRRFKVVWRLVSGLLSAWDTMASTTCLILLWLYIFACIAAEVITNDPQLNHDESTRGIVTNYFGSVPRAVLTLLQFVTMDGISNVYYPLIMAKPILIVYFLPLLLFLSIALMNLVTAVLVEHALEQASQEAELARTRTKEQIKGTLPDLMSMFSELDRDGSGYITREEIADVPLDVLPPSVLKNVSVDSMEDMFELLDVDGGGSLTLEEFLEGLLSLLLLDVPIWAIQLQKIMMPMRKQMNQVSKDLRFFKDVQELHGRV